MVVATPIASKLTPQAIDRQELKSKIEQREWFALLSTGLVTI